MYLKPSLLEKIDLPPLQIERKRKEENPEQNKKNYYFIFNLIKQNIYLR